MKISKPPQDGNVPQCGIKCTISRKSGDMKSSIIKHVISVIQIQSKRLGNISRDKKHENNLIPRDADLDGWLRQGSTKGSS